MGLDDFVDIVSRGRAVPDAVGIDHHQGSGVAKAEAARRREADIGEPLRFDRLAHPVPQDLRASRAAAAVRMCGRTLDVASKDMMPVELRKLEFRFCVHAPAMLGSSKERQGPSASPLGQRSSARAREVRHPLSR